MSNNFETARQTLTQLEEVGAKMPSVTVNYHGTSYEDAKAVVQAFPDAAWSPQRNGGTEWVTGRADGLLVTIFLATEIRTEPSIAVDLLKEVARERA